MRFLNRALVVAVALFPVMAIPAAAAAAPTAQIEINDGNGWQHDASAPLFSMDRIAPGWQQTESFQVRNDNATDADIALQSTDIVERENGCIHGEAQVDSTCGADEGELGHALRFSVYADPANTGAFGTTPVWSGSLYDLQAPLALDDPLAANAVMGVRIVAELPMSTGDEVETDQVGFGLRVDAQQSSTDVLGETLHRHHGGSSSTLAGSTLPGSGGLPFTGFDVATYTAGGLALLTAGALLLGVAKRRERLRTA